MALLGKDSAVFSRAAARACFRSIAGEISRVSGHPAGCPALSHRIPPICRLLGLRVAIASAGVVERLCLSLSVVRIFSCADSRLESYLVPLQLSCETRDSNNAASQQDTDHSKPGRKQQSGRVWPCRRRPDGHICGNSWVPGWAFSMSCTQVLGSSVHRISDAHSQQHAP